MDISALYTQIVVMFLLIGVGAICYKYKLVTDAGSGQMSALLINFAAPAIIIHSFCREFDRDMLGKLIVAFVLSLLLLVISIGIPRWSFARIPQIMPTNACASFFPTMALWCIALTASVIRR